MDFFYNADPNEKRLPPEEVRIRDLQAQVLEEGRRVKIYLEVDPFQKRPNAELAITDPQGRVVAETSIIESMMRKMELTMHLRGEPLSGQHTLAVTLFYAHFEPPAEPGQPPGDIERMVVDTCSRQFEMP